MTELIRQGDVKREKIPRMKITLLIPVLNELSGMQQILPRIRREWYDQLLILDGGSTDGGLEYARAQGYQVVVQERDGLRHGYQQARPLLIGDVVVTFSPDGNSIPELIPPLIEKMREGYDMVIVSRYRQGAKSEDDDLITAFGNWMFTSLINLLFGSQFTDTMVIFRAYKTELIDRLGLALEAAYRRPERLFRTSVSWEPLLSIRCAKYKLNVAEIPGREPKRIGGERKLQPFRWGATYLWQVMSEFFCQDGFRVGG